MEIPLCLVPLVRGSWCLLWSQQDDERPPLELVLVSTSDTAFLRSRLCRVEDECPCSSNARPGQCEPNRSMMGVEQDQQRVVDDPPASLVGFFDRVAREPHAQTPDMLGAPVGVGHLVAVWIEPGQVLDVDAPDLSTLEEPSTPQNGVGRTKTDDLLRECQKLPAGRRKLPVEPARLVVLAVGVVVPSLCPRDLVATTDHRYAL